MNEFKDLYESFDTSIEAFSKLEQFLFWLNQKLSTEEARDLATQLLSYDEIKVFCKQIIEEEN